MNIGNCPSKIIFEIRNGLALRFDGIDTEDRIIVWKNYIRANLDSGV